MFHFAVAMVAAPMVIVVFAGIIFFVALAVYLIVSAIKKKPWSRNKTALVILMFYALATAAVLELAFWNDWF